MFLRRIGRGGAAVRFLRDDKGVVAVLFAGSLVAVAVMAGAAIDYGRASRARTQLQAAVDAATLAAVQLTSATSAERQNAVQGTLAASLANAQLETVTVDVADFETPEGKGVTVNASATVPTSLIRLMNVSSIPVSARAEGVASTSPTAEISLVLDNTGSMVDDMPALKAAASNFVNTIYGAGATTVKMSVVPYVAAVNVGPSFPMASLELTGSGLQSLYYRYSWLASMPDCNGWAQVNPTPAPAPSQVQTQSTSSTTSTPTPAPSGPGRPAGRDRTTSLDGDFGVWSASGSRSVAGFARSLFGISHAAAEVTPNSIDPIATTPYTPGPPYLTTGATADLPDGYTVQARCYLTTPYHVSNMDLFNRMPGVRWKGCVEARKDPYDVTDAPPNPAVIDSMFVPYFAPDEPDTGASGQPYSNNYLNDYHASWVSNNGSPRGWSTMNRFANIFKYDMVNVPRIVETSPTTTGPNAFCPDELLRLTSDKNAILAKINSLNFWSGGGTISSEGVAWGWRTISPNAPFAQGAPYGSVKKYIVLMTDGLNSLVENRPDNASDLLSDYTAYGHLAYVFFGTNRFGGANFQTAESFLNDRLVKVCANAKAAGVSIFTILFRETSPVIKSLLQQCASSPSQALTASDGAALQNAFANVAAQVKSVRLRR